MERKIALVTGSSRGIGRDIALKLADIAAAVVVHYRINRLRALAVVEAIEQKGKESACFQADLTEEREASELVKKAEKKFGKIDILINNVGPILIKPWEKLASKDWEYIFQSNLESAFFCLKAALPGMRKRKWGRIINIGYSRAEQLVAFPTITAYAVAKTGLLILTRTVAAAEASSGITVNMVSPGIIEGGVLPPAKSGPKASLGKFKDVSEAVLFLASEKANFITGTNLIIGGGWKI